MTALAALQEALQRRVLCGDPAIAALVEGEAQDIDARLDIYGHAYRARLTEALGVTYPVLRRVVGQEAFEATARAYIDVTPSTHASIRWYGENLYRELQGMHADLARWEWRLAEVFDSAGDCALSEADLAAVSPRDWPALRLRLHRTVRLFETTTNAVDCWKASVAGTLVPGPQAVPAHVWVAWRRDLAVHFRPVSREETAALACLGHGVTFADLCADLAPGRSSHAAAVRAATWLKAWVGEGLLGREHAG